MNTETFKILELSVGDWVILADTLQDIIHNNGQINDDLKDYLEFEDNPFIDIYNRLVNI